MEQLQLQLKDVNSQLKKMTNLQKKTEERFKEKVKQIKVFNAFFTNIFKDKADHMYDKETKTLLYTVENLQ